MRKNRKRAISIFLIATLCAQMIGLASAQEPKASTDPYADQLVYHAEDLTLPLDGQEGVYTAIDEDALSNIAQLHEGTFLVNFTPSDTSSTQSLIGISNGDLGYPNSYVHLYFSSDRIGFEIRQQTGGDYEKTYVAEPFVAGTEYYAALSADPDFGYRIFLNGVCVLECPLDEISSELGYGFVSDIEGINSGYIGMTKRTHSGAANEYYFYGEVHSADIYSEALPKDYLEEKTYIPEVTKLIYEAEDMYFPDASADVEIDPALVSSSIAGMTKGTFVIAFTPEGESLAQSLIGFSDSSTANSHFHIYINTAAAVPGSNPDRNLVGFEIRRQNGGDILKDNTPVEIELGKQHIMAMTADPDEGYKIFFDGVLVYDMPAEVFGIDYGFMADIPGIDSGHIGGTIRNGSKAYPYEGSIDYVRIYNGVLSDEELLAETAKAPVDPGIVQKVHLFNFGDWHSPGLRIPSIIRTDNDVLIAAADIRFGNSNDPPNNCDIGIRISKDDGNTWSEPRMLLNFLDYPNEPSPDQPCTNSASYCDSVLVKGDNNRIFLFVDAMKGQISAPTSMASSGYKEIDGVKRLILIDPDDPNTTYYVGDYDGYYAPVYVDDGLGSETPYSVGKYFELYENGEEISNIFYLASPLQVLSTVFTLMIYTDDDGETWSEPRMMNPDVKTDEMHHCGTAPGVGIQIQQGEYAGRILVPYYYNTGSTSNVVMNGCLVYSDDNGQTWTRGGSPNDTRTGGPTNMGEIQVIEMPLAEGETVSQLKMFIRVPGHAEIATSLDGGQTWLPDVEVEDHLVMSATSGCQMSVMRYSTPIDGQDAIIFSNPAATTRSNGAIQIAYIVTEGEYEDGTPKYGFDWQYMRVIRDGDFGYSCLVELPNGNIGILYEEQSKVNSVDHLTYAEFTLDYLKN